MMKAIEIFQPGDAACLRMCSRPIPQPGKGEVLIRVHTSGVNRPDVLQRIGRYPVPAGASDLPGLEVSGTIILGDFSEINPFELTLGSEVCALVQGGGYAEYCVAPLAQCLPVPKTWTLQDAAGLPETFFTVWSNVFDRGGLSYRPNDPKLSFLVHGGSSGIGVTAIQLAKVLGHRVFATAGSEDKCRACEHLGAERAINYRTEDFVAVVQDMTAGRGVDVILDMVAGHYIPRDIACLADDGRIVVLALLGGSKAQVDFGQVLRRRLTLTGSTLRPRSVAFKAEIARNLYQYVWPLLASGRIKPVVHSIFPAAEAMQAHRLMESSQHIGKILLSWV